MSSAEIVAQAYLARVHMGLNLRNLVFMGMGEPLDNLDAVAQAVEVLSDQRGMDIAMRHMTISTCGLVPGIRRLAEMNRPTLKLAVSLNAPNDRLRNALMPVNRRYPLSELKSALAAYPLARGNAILVEYVLIKNVNDGAAHAAQLADFLGGLNAKLNLIPYNPRQGARYKAPSAGDVAAFQQQLIDREIFVRLRASKGVEILAACGQLGAASGVSP
jgi:23S rRNA (adenine2503-C2)-methyltransferase